MRECRNGDRGCGKGGSRAVSGVQHLYKRPQVSVHAPGAQLLAVLFQAPPPQES